MKTKWEKPIRNPQVMWKQLGTEIVTLDHKSHQYHILNATAALIFELATGENSLEAIANEIAENFEVDITKALDNTCKTVIGMRKLGLLACPQSIEYVEPSFEEVTNEHFDASIKGGAAIACRSLLGA